MCHVLIIEDEWLIADHTAQLVEAAGNHTIAFAGSEDDAVAQAQAHQPMVIISDVNLGSGSGLSAVKRILASLGEIPVMFVTGEPRGFEPHLAATPVLHKPVDDQLLIATFRAIAPLT